MYSESSVQFGTQKNCTCLMNLALFLLQLQFKEMCLYQNASVEVLKETNVFIIHEIIGLSWSSASNSLFKIYAKKYLSFKVTYNLRLFNIVTLKIFRFLAFFWFQTLIFNFKRGFLHHCQILLFITYLVTKKKVLFTPFLL